MSSHPWGPHGPQAGPNQVTPNPTPAYVPPASSFESYGPSSVTYNIGSGPMPGYKGPRKKGYIVALILTFLFGPLGLFYASKKGALVLLFLLFAVPITLGAIGLLPGGSMNHPFAILDHEAIMEPMWSFFAFVSIVWSVIAVNRFNAREKAKA